MKGHQPMQFDRTFRLSSTSPSNWYVEWDDGSPHMITGTTAREVMEKALAQVQADAMPTLQRPDDHG
jgi:hypothetical protein